LPLNVCLGARGCIHQYVRFHQDTSARRHFLPKDTTTHLLELRLFRPEVTPRDPLCCLSSVAGVVGGAGASRMSVFIGIRVCQLSSDTTVQTRHFLLQPDLRLFCPNVSPPTPCVIPCAVSQRLLGARGRIQYVSFHWYPFADTVLRKDTP